MALFTLHQVSRDGTAVCPTIWPTPILNASTRATASRFDILGTASPDTCNDLTVVIQTWRRSLSRTGLEYS